VKRPKKAAEIIGELTAAAELMEKGILTEAEVRELMERLLRGE